MSRCQSSLLDGFTDDWDAALLSEGTLRPKRAASAMNLREVMKKLNKAPVGAVTKQELENQFSRSMKLLGLDIVDSVSSKTSAKPKINNVAPRTITRLEKPTVSYEDIRNAVTDGVDRKVLSQAAYERWYFRKLEEERDSRKLKGFFDLGKHRSKLFEHGMTFSEWMEKKEKERRTKKSTPEKNNQEKTTTIKRRLPMSSPATKEAAEKAYKEWMSKKKEEDAKRKQKMKEELEAKNASKTREDAEKAFEEWKRTHDEKLKKMEQRKKNKERKLKEKEQEEKERHLQDSEKAFNAWLSSKNQSFEKKAEKSKKQSMKKSMEEQRKLAEKRYEAKLAFEEWLEKKLELEAARAPTPEAKVTKSIQTDGVVKPATPVPKCRPSATFPRNLMVPWADFSVKNLLTSPKHQKRDKADARTPTPKKQKVKFADSFDSDSSLEATLKHSAVFRDFTKIRELSDNKSLMMLYHRRDPSAFYYARDLI